MCVCGVVACVAFMGPAAAAADLLSLHRVCRPHVVALVSVRFEGGTVQGSKTIVKHVPF